MIAPLKDAPLDYRSVARRLAELLTDEELADLRRAVLEVQVGTETTEDERNAAVRSALAELLDTAANALQQLLADR